MRDSNPIAEVRCRLLFHGFDRYYAARVAQELEGHRLDLIDEGLRQGLPQAEAETRAEAALGGAETLAREFAARLHTSAWLGRHPTLGFGILALFGTVLWWALLLAAAASAGGLLWAEKQPGVLPLGLEPFIGSIEWIRVTSYLAIPCLICWVARRWHCGWKGALWGCLVAAVHNAMHNFIVSNSDGSGLVTWGYSFSSAQGPDLLPVLAPLAVWAIHFAWNARPESPRRDTLQIESLEL